ncbi:MAG TPA: hypothetical protein VGM32_13340 [Rhodopila sp.]
MLDDVFARQIQAFHIAILDNCDRAARAGQTDATVLHLRANALALVDAQFAMVALLTAEAPVTAGDRHQDNAPLSGAQEDRVPGLAEASMFGATSGGQEDRVLAGDALSRFVSRRLQPGESPHEVWQQMLQEVAAPGRRNSAFPG